MHADYNIKMCTGYMHAYTQKALSLGTRMGIQQQGLQCLPHSPAQRRGQWVGPGSGAGVRLLPNLGGLAELGRGCRPHGGHWDVHTNGSHPTCNTQQQGDP